MFKLLSKMVIVDIETVGTQASAGIIEIGGLFLDKLEVKERFSSPVRTVTGTTVDQETLDWWNHKDRKDYFVHLKSSPDFNYSKYFDFTDRIRIFDPKYICSWRQFDIPILKHSFGLLKIPIHRSFNFGALDAWSVAEVLGYKREGVTSHKALEDCIQVYNLLRKIYNESSSSESVQ